MMTPEGGQFELGALIGEGSYGKVFECFDKKDGKKFAMKKITLRKLSEDDRSLAETEARLLTSLQNEYILHAVTAFQENETLCIVTEFCDQGDLAEFLEERKGESLDEQRIVEWFRQICSALEYLHGRNILHRDIKTPNIFLTGNEMTAKLGDFGLAKLLESSTQKVLSFRGSPYYMSPEMYTNKPYNSKTDIWALGVCVYEMVALKRPFDATKMQQLVYQIINDELPPLPEGYSPELIEIIESMMCREMDRRPSALELLQNALFKNHNSSKVELIPNKKTTLRKLSTYEDLDKTISDNTLRINNNAKEPPSSTSTKIRSFFQFLKRSLMGGATGSDGRNSISSNKMNTSQDEVWAKDLPDERHLYVYFWKRYSVFSQEYGCEFVVDGITYNSAEQYMMHQKAVLMGDQENAEIIMALDVPHEIKQIGNQLQNFNAERWEESCQAIVERGNMEKFSQNESLKEQLFSTFPKTLVEASPLDNIWGIGLARDDRRAWNKLSWRGQNLLGEILTKVRDKLMEPFLIPVVPENTEGDSIQEIE